MALIDAKKTGIYRGNDPNRILRLRPLRVRSLLDALALDALAAQLQGR